MLENDLYQVQNLAPVKFPDRNGKAMTVTLFSDGKVFGAPMFGGKFKKQAIMPRMRASAGNRTYMFTKKKSIVNFVKFFVE